MVGFNKAVSNFFRTLQILMYPLVFCLSIVNDTIAKEKIENYCRLKFLNAFMAAEIFKVVFHDKNIEIEVISEELLHIKAKEEDYLKIEELLKNLDQFD